MICFFSFVSKKIQSSKWESVAHMVWGLCSYGMRVLLNWYESSSHVMIWVLCFRKLRKTNAGNAEHKGNRCVVISVFNIGGIGTGLSVSKDVDEWKHMQSEEELNGQSIVKSNKHDKGGWRQGWWWKYCRGFWRRNGRLTWKIFLPQAHSSPSKRAFNALSRTGK